MSIVIISFNSTLVRLQPVSLHFSVILIQSFNSTLVRLQRADPTEDCSGIHCFNSTLVRLQLRTQLILYLRALPFQFHTGSITAFRQQERIQQVFPFQFHTGSITASIQFDHISSYTLVSIPHWFDYSAAIVGFAKFPSSVSIPHWFDYSGFKNCSHLGQILRFNSTLVRLQPSIDCIHSRCNILFQFHTGSITAAGMIMVLL